MVVFNVYLSDDDVSMLDTFRVPGESRPRTIARLLRQAMGIKPVPPATGPVKPFVARNSTTFSAYSEEIMREGGDKTHGI